MTAAKADDLDRLVGFLRDRDVRCPHCGYNLRNLTEAVCPECRQTLRLTVGMGEIRFGWFLAAVTPSLFSGLAAVLLGVMIGVARMTGPGPPPVAYLLVLFGLASGTAAVVLIILRQRFVRLRPRTQRAWALAAWLIHAAPFLGLLVLLVVTA